MLIKAFGKSDVGRRREKNEDSFLVDNERCTYLVADGMGGHLGGECASRLAIDTITEILKGLENDPEATLPESTTLRPDDYAGFLRFAMSVASRRIFEKALAETNLHGMGTTSVALLLRNNKAYIANVGDSRIYQIRGKKITQVTKDHSLVNEQIRAGVISPNDSKAHRFKNIITRSVGYQMEVDADVDIKVVRANDRYLLCSDGLSNQIEDSEMLDIIINNDLRTAVEQMVSLANEHGGDDNITAVLVEVVEVDKARAAAKPEDTTVDM